jgi:1A family penicillin-binding protein
MSQPPHSSPPLSQRLTQAVQNWGKPVLKSGARVARLVITNGENGEKETYTLLGDRHGIGRSSRNCDIVINNQIVSQSHCYLERDPQNPQSFLLRDEDSTNGTFFGKQRLSKRQPIPLRHGDTFTLAPPELATGVTVRYENPSPWGVNLLRYGLYGAGGLLSLSGLIFAWAWMSLSLESLANTSSSNPIVIYAGDGETLLNPVQSDTHREIERLSEFSPYLPQAVIASEDSRYYWHLGVDPYGIARAVVTNLQGGGIRQGASTLTQQLARSLYPQVGRENTAGRKLREMLVATKLETLYSKDELLRYYLNRVYLGVGNYGFEDAAQFYFDKSARNLNISEAATLVAMLPAPNLYNPVQDHKTAVKLRNRVISRMAKLGMISEEEAARARRSLLKVSPKATKALSKVLAPHFYSQVLQELQQLLPETSQEGNWIVETTLDVKKQKTAEATVKSELERAGKRYNFSEGVLVTLNSKNGEILALVGGKNYDQSQFNRAVQAQRQPGSTFKVFAYAAALEKGISPSKTYPCEALFWQGQNYKPCERSSGNIDMYQALAQSENSVSLRIAQEAGLDAVISLAQRLGINSPLKASPGLVLGESEVNVLEITGAYATIANQGVRQAPHSIRRIFDARFCTAPEQYQTCPETYNFAKDNVTSAQVISPELARSLTRMLQGVIETGTGKAAFLGRGEAGKTGTTNRGVDLWFIGYLPQEQLVTGVWLGNDDPQPTRGGSQQAAQLWKNYMGRILP